MSDTAAADLLFRPVTELAAQVRSGELSSRELVQTSLDRIEALNPQLNAFVDVFAEEALAAADAVKPGDERPLAGVPVAIKNNRAVEGKRLTFAAEFMGDFIAPYDHNVVRRLKEAGAIVVGTTTLPEYGILPTTETRRFGPTRNPWDPTRTTGGSSGGSAAAVASGMVPLAHANDGGGSTRIPASCCGLVGLKPQRGRISLAPEVGHNLLAHDGVLTHTIAETAALLDVLAGYELGDLTWAPPAPEPFADAAGRAPGRLRVALTTTLPLPDGTLDPVCEQAVRDAGALLESLGHSVEEVEAPWQSRELLEVFTAVFGPLVSSQIGFASLIAGREPTADDMEPLSWAIWNVCKNIDSVQAALAEMQLHGVARGVIAWTSGYDVVLCPALAEAPVPLGTIDPLDAGDPMGAFRRSGQFTPYTAISNVTGSPAISVPLYQRPEGDAAAGLPLGVQLIGQPAEEGALLALAAQIEQASPWADRRPPIS
jgi:amidase